MSNDREILTWQDYGSGIRELARQIADDVYRPDIILGIARGGLIPTGSLGYALSVKNTYLINVEYYTDVEERLDVPVILPPYLQLVDLGHASVLIVDDVADTGHTLEMVRDFCRERVSEVRTAVLYEKSHSLVKCDWVWKRTDRWINFPWSTQAPVVSAEDARHRVLDA